MKELKLNDSGLVWRLIFLALVLSVQISAVVLHSIQDYSILVKAINGMMYLLIILFAYFIFKVIRHRDISILQRCMECTGAFLAIYLYRDFLYRVIDNIVPKRFIMMPYIVGFFVSMVFKVILERGYFNHQVRIKVYGVVRFILFVFSFFFVAAALYSVFILKNYSFAVWPLLVGTLMFYICVNR